MSFYPAGYEVKDTQSDYMRLTEGDHKVRILRSPIMGWESWTEVDGGRKPQRFKSFQQAVNTPNSDGQIKEFHAFIVWDYESNMIRLLNVTQKSIQRAIYVQTQDEDWSDPTKYDIVIKRSGKGMDTEYSLVFKLPKPLSEQIKKAFDAVKIDEEQYFNGGHPIVREQSENSGIETLREVVKTLDSDKITDEDAKRMSSEQIADDIPAF